MSDIAKTPKELECKKKYLYEYSMFWECNDGSKCQILEDDVVRLLNEQQATIQSLQREIEEWKKENRELSDQIQEFERIPKSIRSVWIE